MTIDLRFSCTINAQNSCIFQRFLEALQNAICKAAQPRPQAANYALSRRTKHNNRRARGGGGSCLRARWAHNLWPRLQPKILCRKVANTWNLMLDFELANTVAKGTNMINGCLPLHPCAPCHGVHRFNWRICAPSNSGEHKRRLRHGQAGSRTRARTRASASCKPVALSHRAYAYSHCSVA